MRKNKKLILISSILATTAMVAVPTISIVNNINTVNGGDSQLDNVVQNSQQVEVDSIDSNIDTVEDGNQVKAAGDTFTVGATALMSAGWGTNITGDLTFTVLDDVANTVNIMPDDKWTFATTNFSIQNTITSNGVIYDVAEIDVGAFANCFGLKGTLTIPASVTTIGESAFANCISLNSLDLSNASKLTSIDGNAFAGCSSLKGTLTIPASVTSIGDAAFVDCSGLGGTLTIPASVISIGSDAFNGCIFSLIELKDGNTKYCMANNLGGNCYGILDKSTGAIFNFAQVASDQIIGGLLCGQLEIPNTVTTLGDDAFKYCYGLTSVNIPTSLETIGASAFLNCSSLTDVTIPASVNSIGNSAFKGIGSKNTTFLSKTPPENLGINIFGTKNGTSTITVPNGTKDKWVNTSDILNKLGFSTLEQIKETIPPAPTGSITLSGSQGSDKIVAGMGGNIAIAAKTDGTLKAGTIKWDLKIDPSTPTQKLDEITVIDPADLGCKVNVASTVVASTYKVILTATGEVNDISTTSNTLKLTITVDPVAPEPDPAKPANDLDLPLIIGASVGGAVGVAAIAGGITYGVKRGKAKK